MNIWQELDIVYKIEESKSQERTIKSNLRILLCHMLKCKYQNNYKYKTSWRGSIINSFYSIIEQFKDIGKGKLFKKFYMGTLDLTPIYNNARKQAILETALSEDVFPEICEWSKEELIDENFITSFIKEYGQDIN